MIRTLVSALHDASGSPEGWRQFLGELASTFGSSFTGFTRWNRADRSDISFSAGVDASYVQAYHRHWAAVNPWILNSVGRFADGTVLPSHVFVPDSAFVRSEFYNEFLGRERIGRHGIAAQLESNPETVHLSLVRTAWWPPFGETEVRTLERLVPHIRHAVTSERVAVRLRAEHAAVLDSLDALPYGVVVLGRAPVLNACARRLLQSSPAVFELRDGTLRLGHVNADAALQRRIAQARSLRAAVDRPFAVNLGPGRFVRITVIAGFNGAAWAAQRPPLVVLEAYGPDDNLLDRLMREYRLTAREAQLVSELLAKHSLRDVAGSMGITWATARRHLARTFQKTGVHSQRELLALAERWPGR